MRRGVPVHTRIAGSSRSRGRHHGEPAGTGRPSYQAQVGDLQEGAIDTQTSRGLADRTDRAAAGGTEFLMTRLRVASNGPDSYRAQTLCP